MPDSQWKSNQQKFGAKYKVLGKDYTTPDLYAKVTGQAKYAEAVSYTHLTLPTICSV